jgi:hypothetical protein
MNTPPRDPTRLVIVGATGMVGGYALRYALDHAAVGAVTAIGRRTLDISHPKLKEVLHRDFADCSALADALSGEDAAVFCLGAYTGVVSDAELRKVTVDYTVAFAQVLRTASPAAAFSFLSGSGADQTGQSQLAFARYKGEAEKALLTAGFSRVYIFRPAYIYPVCRDWAPMQIKKRRQTGLIVAIGLIDPSPILCIELNWSHASIPVCLRHADHIHRHQPLPRRNAFHLRAPSGLRIQDPTRRGGYDCQVTKERSVGLLARRKYIVGSRVRR